MRGSQDGSRSCLDGCNSSHSLTHAHSLSQGGISTIESSIRKLGAKHAEHIAAYGEGNERRLTGAHETASIDDFSYGIANRGCSIRIPRSVEADKCGYLEDRRPSSNMDPYIVTSMVFNTCTDPNGVELDIARTDVAQVA